MAQPSASNNPWEVASVMPVAAGGGQRWDVAHTEPSEGAFSRFVSSAVSAINPIPAIQDWWHHGDEFAKAGDAMHVLDDIHKRAAALPENKGKPVNQWKTPPLTGDEQAIVDRGMNANLGSTEGQHPFLAPATGAVGQAMGGDYAGAAGTLVGGYGGPVAIERGVTAARAVPGIARNAVGAAIDTVHSPGTMQMVKGAGKAAAGAGAMATMNPVAAILGLDKVVSGVSDITAGRTARAAAKVSESLPKSPEVNQGAFYGPRASELAPDGIPLESAPTLEALPSPDSILQAAKDAKRFRGSGTQQAEFYGPRAPEDTGIEGAVLDTPRPVQQTDLAAQPLNVPRGTPAADPAVVARTQLLNDLSQSLAQKPFNKLDPNGQANIQRIADQAQPPPPPPTVFQKADVLAAQPVPNLDSVAPRPAPQSAPVTMRDIMAPKPTQPTLDPSMNPDAEVHSYPGLEHEPSLATSEGRKLAAIKAARTTKGRAIARYLHEQGMDSSNLSVETHPETHPLWEKAADEQGVALPRSKESVQAVIDALKEIETKRTMRDMMRGTK